MNYVYLILSENGQCKIGRTSKKPEDRLRQLQTGSGDKLILSCSFATSNAGLMERMLHFRYKMKRTNGEWFALDDSEIRGFMAACENAENTILLLEDNPYVKKKKDDEHGTF